LNKKYTGMRKSGGSIEDVVVVLCVLCRWSYMHSPIIATWFRPCTENHSLICLSQRFHQSETSRERHMQEYTEREIRLIEGGWVGDLDGSTVGEAVRSGGPFKLDRAGPGHPRAVQEAGDESRGRAWSIDHATRPLAIRWRCTLQRRTISTRTSTPKIRSKHWPTQDFTKGRAYMWSGGRPFSAAQGADPPIKV